LLQAQAQQSTDCEHPHSVSTLTADIQQTVASVLASFQAQSCHRAARLGTTCPFFRLSLPPHNDQHLPHIPPQCCA
jgi:hypothetical protein